MNPIDLFLQALKDAGISYEEAGKYKDLPEDKKKEMLDRLSKSTAKLMGRDN